MPELNPLSSNKSLPSVIKTLFNTFWSLDTFTKSSIIFIVLMIIVTPFIVTQSFDIRQQAMGQPVTTENSYGYGSYGWSDYSFLASPTPLPSPFPTATPTPVPTATPTPRPTNTPTPTATPTPLPTATPTPRPTNTPTPTNTPVPTATPTPRPTATPTSTSTPTPQPTSTPVPTIAEQSGFFFTRSGTTNPIGQLPPLTPGRPITLDLFLDTRQNEVTGFDLTLNFDNNLLLQPASIVEQSGAQQFNTQLVNTIQNNTWRFAKANTQTTTQIRGVLKLATLTFTPQRIATGTLRISQAEITSSQSDTPLTVSLPAIPYEILGPHIADIDHNGCVDIADFQIWSRAFQGLSVPPSTSPDVNSDGRINILDFNVWYKAVRDMAQPCG